MSVEFSFVLLFIITMSTLSTFGDKNNIDIIDTVLLDNISLTPNSRSTVQFHWKISVTRTTEKTEWYSIKGDAEDPYRKAVTIMYETFNKKEHHELVWKRAKSNYGDFLVNMRLLGPDKFIESIFNTRYMLLSELLEKQKLWRDNWYYILDLFDTLGLQGFNEMMEMVLVSPVTENFVSNSKPTYWTPGPNYYTSTEQPIWTPDGHFYTPNSQEDIYARAFRSFSPPPPGCFTCAYEAKSTPSQGIIPLPVSMNYTSMELEEAPSWEGPTTTTTSTTQQPELEPEMYKALERYWNRTVHNVTDTSDRRAFAQNKLTLGKDGFGDRFHAMNYFYAEYDETTVTGQNSSVTERTKKVLTHCYTKRK